MMGSTSSSSSSANLIRCLGVLLLLLGSLGSCNGRRKDDRDGTIRLEMLHRFSPNSPNWRPHYSDPTHLLKDLIKLDEHRQKSSFRRVLQEPRRSEARIKSPLTEESVVSSELISGSSIGSGLYFAEVKIGTPPRKFPLIVDTGSDLTWVQCSETSPNTSSVQQIRDHPAPVYSSNASSSFVTIPCTADECMFVPAPEGSSCSAKSPTACDYTYSYSDQSRSTGILGYETIRMKFSTRSSGRGVKSGRGMRHVRIENVAFGCGLVNIGQSFSGASGVLGLGKGPVSFTTQVKGVLGGIFSYCLVDYLAPGGANVSSELQFGRTKWGNQTMFYTPMVSNPVDKDDTFYYVNVLHMAVNGVVINGSESPAAWRIDADGNGGTVLDSGTTLSFFREPVYSEIIRALNETIYLPKVESLRGFELCYNTSSVSSWSSTGYDEGLPKLSLVFEGGATMEPPPNNFMVLVARDVKCVSFRNTSGFNIIGNLLQQDFRVEYDQVKARIGFEWSPCSSDKN